ncbi:glycoside hydrolase [Westerdykella ornata]|uniref:chitinase n=1 Tax=Westerdykella ornata TaxID=318751 RepID=A0A6A6JE68_WESOR|nr:glycoside hydrolase [Westerdykella ornata]KAF2274910.1 glycoside hydrolase [Westerdykella ornata]
MPSLSRAATLAAGLLATAVSATFNPASSRNVAVYWGQGYDQIPLSDVCNDENVDIVNLAFVNQFPKKRGDYPATNFANACGEQFFEYPDGTLSGLRSYCPSIGPGIKDCQAKGKKVLLSIGGGWPTDYYLQSKDIAEYFAEFLWGAFGPQTAKWVADGKPRPFGDASVDGFDLDLEAFMEPAPFSGYLDANYDYFVKHLKNKLFPTGPSTYYISGAPQCVLPDARLAAAISKSSFDFVFIQFYNTPQCSSRAGYNGIVGTATSFTFDQWVAWLKKNSVNKQVRLYLGLPANEAGAPNDVTSYLTPAEANKLVTFYAKKYPEIFGGVMLWEASLAARNKICEKNYNSWIKDILVGKYSTSPCAPKPSSSSTRASSTISSNRSSTISSTPTPVVSSSKTSASPTSSAVTSSAQSSAYPTSSAAPSSAVTSSAQSSVYGTSSAAPSSAAPSSVQSSRVWHELGRPQLCSTVLSPVQRVWHELRRYQFRGIIHPSILTVFGSVWRVFHKL